jgi:hypothetical protein
MIIGAAAPGITKTWTIDERQVQLMQDINAGQKSKELTLKEANKLRSYLADVARKKKKFLKRNANKLTQDDTVILEGDLNKISVNISKLKLEKRAQVIENNKNK